MPAEKEQSLDTAWRIFTALCDWNDKVDVKAGFILTIDTAVLAGIIVLSEPDANFAGLTGWARGYNIAGLICIFLSALSAAAVVCPILRPKRKRRTEADRGNFIYFGHLELMDTSEILKVLAKEDALLPALAQELRNLSKMAWLKYRLTQVALFLVTGGGILLAVTLPARHGHPWWVLLAVPVAAILFVWQLIAVRSFDKK